MKQIVAGFLVDSLIGRSAARQGKRVGGIEPSARDELARLARQGNVQRLQMKIDCIVAATRNGHTITTSALGGKKRQRS